MNSSKFTHRMMSNIKCNISYFIFFIAFCVVPHAYSQDEYVLSGWVRGINNEPIQDVTISVRGSLQKLAISNEKGEYSIKVKSGNVWITFQPVGDWETKTLFLDSRQTLNVYLAKKGFTTYNNKVLWEGVDRLSRNVISAHQNISDKQMKYTGNTTVDQFFQTQITGALVSNQSGMPGSGTSTFLRGISTLNTTNEPLYVVDGIPLERSSDYASYFEGYNYNPITSLDPFDVSYITVYKDPSYTSKYGFSGANGVIEIQTLNPDASETTIDFKYRTGIEVKPDYLPQLESTHYRMLANELLYSSGMPQEEYTQSYPGLFYTPEDGISYIPYSNNTNWQDEVFQNTLMQNGYFSIKGGDAIAKYGISVGYLTKTGVIKSTSYDRFNARFAGTFNIIQRIRMQLNVNMVNTNMSLRESGLNTVTSPIISGLWKSPMLSPYGYDDNGNRLNTTADLDALGVSNPLALSRAFVGDNSNTRFTTSAKLIGEISSKLNIVSQLSVNYNTMTEDSFSPDLGMAAYSNGETTNEVSGYVNTYKGLYSNTYLDYSDILGKKKLHRVSALIGMKYKQVDFQNDFAKTGSTPSDAYTSLGYGEVIYDYVGGNIINYTWMSFNGNLNYDYKTKYLLNINVSSDASTSIGREANTPLSVGNVPMGLFYSLGAAWRLSNEPFMKNVSLLEDLKIRASYGTAGNDNFSVLLSQPHYRTDHFNILGVSVPGSRANPTLSYETTSTFNAGLDLVLKGGRHQVIIDWYNATVDDMLAYIPLPEYIGESVFPSNGGKVNTKGIEFTLNSRLIDYQDFAFDLGIRLGRYRTEILEVPNGSIIRDIPGLGQVISREGEALTAFYGYQFQGVFANSQESRLANVRNDKELLYRAGDAIFKDITGNQGVPDHVINNYDKVSIGSPAPDLTGIISAQISYKKLTLRAISHFMTGQEVFNYVRYQNEKMVDLSNQSIKTLQRWSYEGQHTDVPQATWGDPIGNNDFSSRWIEDGSYLRLKELSLAYNLNKSFLFMKNIEAYVTVENILTLTNYTGYDPELSYSSSSIFQGIDYGAVPQTRSFVFGVNISL